MNRNLKIIAGLSKLANYLFFTGRHIFATTRFDKIAAPVESISKMLEYTRIPTTVFMQE